MIASKDNIFRSAVLSSCQQYRYALTRRWADGPLMSWVMLNPSTADAIQDDPTIRRCMGFARQLGYAGIEVCNQFAFRTNNPRELLVAHDPQGPSNYQFLIDLPAPIFCGWGNVAKQLRDLMSSVLLIRQASLRCFGITKSGHPRHPLYLPADAREQVYVYKT